MAIIFLESFKMNNTKFCRGCNYWTSDFLDGCGLCYSCMDYTPKETKKENIKQKYAERVDRTKKASEKEREQRRNKRILLSLGRDIN